MKKWIIVPAICLLLLSACSKGDSPEPAEEATAPAEESIGAVAAQIAANLDDAKASLSEGEIAKGLGMLLDVTLLTRPEDQLPEGFKETITSAREAFNRMDFAAGGESVAEAWQIWSSETGLSSETRAGEAEAERTPAPVAEGMSKLIDASKEDFKQGLANEGVAKILQALLLISPRD